MKYTRPLLCIVLGLALLLAACQTAVVEAPTVAPTTAPTIAPTQAPTAVPPTATSVPPTATPGVPVLTLTGVDGSTKSLTMDDVKALPVTEGMAGIKSSTGAITLPETYRGVALKDLLDLVGGVNETMGLSLVAEDGYAMTFSYDQLMNGSFIAYDPANGDELKNPPALTCILAYERAGQPLDKKADGQLRLVIISKEGAQVTDGHWSVKWVAGIDVKELVKEWSLAINGTLNEVIDRSTFESCANCHKATWKDDKAQEWVGVPLWLLMGYVDDEIKHEGPAFNEAMAQASYTVEVRAADGFSASFDSATVSRNNDLVVAFSVNGNPLEDKHFPLRMVGVGLDKKQMVGQIAEVTLLLEGVAVPAPAPTAEPTAEPTAASDNASADLVVTGLVDKELKYSEADLRALEVVKLTLEHPKNGPQEFEGLRLYALLESAGLKPDATKAEFVCADGYTATIDLSELKACPNCLFAFTNTVAKFKLAMPGFGSGMWLKEVVKIEIK